MPEERLLETPQKQLLGLRGDFLAQSFSTPDPIVFSWKYNRIPLYKRNTEEYP